MNISYRLFSTFCLSSFKNNSSVSFRRILRLSNVSCNIILPRYLTGEEKVSLDNPLIQNYVEVLLNEYRCITQSVPKQRDVGRITHRLSELEPIHNIHSQKQNLLECLLSLNELNLEGKSDDADLQKQIEEEKQSYRKKIEELNQQLLNVILPSDIEDSQNKLIMEINAGVGGQEAMLFARELMDMYCSYVNYKGWMLGGCDNEESDLGGLRHSTLFISGIGSFKHLKYEAGVHRVQRIPATEKSGRLHTSTVSITVLPEPEEVAVQIHEKDLRIERKRASGAGGQHVNKTESAVRITHLPSGISVECQTDRSQIQNRKQAMQKLRAILYKNKIDEQLSSTISARKMQVKSNLRSEKIRTYNYNQDRISDHRVDGNVHNLREFLCGGESLDILIQKVEANSKKQLLFQKIKETCSSTNL